MTPISQNFIMSDDMALGLFDSDGAVMFGAEKAKNKSSNSILYKVTYFLGQSLSKADVVERFADKFGAKTVVDSLAVEFRVNVSSQEGQRLRSFFQKNEPINPYRLRDFFISEEVIPLLNKSSKSRIELITLARLVSNKSRLVSKSGESEAYFSELCAHIDATADEIQQGSQVADSIILQIETKLQAKQQKLITIKLSNDYVLGAHFGDGSLYVGLSWKPTAKNVVERLRCEPEWAISGDNEAYCKTFVTTFGGLTKPVDKKGQRKFVVSGIKQCLGVIPLFDKASWMPQYKQEQFNRWKEALSLLESQGHFSEEGIKKLLDLTYGLAEKGQRKYSKEQYLEWGLAWLNNPNRQKRAPRG